MILFISHFFQKQSFDYSLLIQASSFKQINTNMAFYNIKPVYLTSAACIDHLLIIAQAFNSFSHCCAFTQQAVQTTGLFTGSSFSQSFKS